MPKLPKIQKLGTETRQRDFEGRYTDLLKRVDRNRFFHYRKVYADECTAERVMS